MSKKSQPVRSQKALRPNARAPKAATKDSFQNFEARIGYGTGNVSDGGSYNMQFLSRNRQQLDAMYRSSWICGKAVDSVAEDMTKRGIEIASELEPGAEGELMALWKSLQLWDRIADSIKWARLYGGSIAVMLIDGQKMDTPLNIASVGRDQFKGLLVLDRWMAQPDLSNLVTELGPHLGLPKFYTVFSGQGMPLQASTRIHYSRVLRMEGQDLPYFQRIAEMLWGQSVIERLFDRLLAFDSTTQGAAQLVYKAHLRTYKVKGLRDLIASGGPALEGLVKQINFIRSTQTNEGMTLMDSDDEFEAHAYQFGGLDTVLLQFAQQLSGALDIPLTRLFGQSPAGLNSTGESDLRTYYDGINQQQERRLRTGVDTLLQVTHLSKFGTPLPEGTTFTFRPLWQLTDTEKAAIAGQVATAVTALRNGTVIGRQTALKELKQSSKITGIFTNIDDATITAADDDVDSGEFGASDPFGEDGGGKSKTKDEEWNESDHPRADNGEFASGGGEALHPSIAPYFANTNEALKGKPREALEWVRGGEGRYVQGAIPHPDFPEGITLLHGVPGDPNNEFKGGFGVSHIDVRRKGPEYLNQAIGRISTLRRSARQRHPGTIELTDGRTYAIVSLEMRGQKTPVWLLTSYGPMKK